MILYYDRRKFLKYSASAGAGLALMNTPLKTFATVKQSKVRVGMIAVGLRGQLHLTEMLKRNDVEVIAMADPDKRMMGMARALVKQFGKKTPVEYGNGNYD
ncbi:MAG TPA: twin-arginine translocation signal domain-containing protein [Ginsengibacter sp.]|nr:twin-arginine translocation signal domain-containing protein [Ginsengibacter sp.]